MDHEQLTKEGFYATYGKVGVRTEMPPILRKNGHIDIFCLLFDNPGDKTQEPEPAEGKLSASVSKKNCVALSAVIPVFGGACDQ